MKKKLVILAMVLAAVFFWMPADNSVSAQNGNGRGRQNGEITKHPPVIWQPGKHDDKWRKHEEKWRKKDSHGYRNYGQYRRTQVGNRRYRLVRRYYMNDGVRLSRLVRVLY